MAFFSSVFSSVGVQASNAALSLGNYRKIDGQLRFISHSRTYGDMIVYAAKRTLMQMTFAKINDLYPAYLRDMDRKNTKKAYEANQGKEVQKIIENGDKTDSDTYNKQGVSIFYKGKPANEGLLLWVQSEDGKPVELDVQTYWDKIKGLSGDQASKSHTMQDTVVKVPGEPAFLDLGAIVQAQGSNNVVLTKVQGRDYSRKEFISGGDMNFTVTGKIVSNYPDVYPYADVSRFVALMQHKGVVQVYNLLFQQFNVTQILIKDFQMGQNQGFKNEQPYSFTCVAVEPDEAVAVVQDTINGANLQIAASKKKGWAKKLLDEVKKAAANQAAQMVESLTASVI